jgi:hypothetical protein
MRAVRRLIVLLAAPALLVLGCGGTDDTTPAACLEGAQVYLHALAEAPGEVTLASATPISECLAENQSGGDLAAVGAAMLRAATELNAKARAEPGGAASLRLGYLIGAARRGAEHTEGIHAELIRRLSAAARYSPGNHSLPPAFRRAYRRGYEAGAARG